MGCEAEGEGEVEPTAVCRRALGCEWGGGADLRIAGRVARWASSASDLERESIGPIECQARGGPVKSSARFVLRAARSGGPAAALPRRRLCACCYAATREPRSPLGSPRGWCRTRLARGGSEDERVAKARLRLRTWARLGVRAG